MNIKSIIVVEAVNISNKEKENKIEANWKSEDNNKVYYESDDVFELNKRYVELFRKFPKLFFFISL